MGSGQGFALRQKALQAIEKSTRMFKVAIELIKQGNGVEAERLRNEARMQRILSMLLMSEANSLERNTELTKALSSTKAESRFGNIAKNTFRGVRRDELSVPAKGTR